MILVDETVGYLLDRVEERNHYLNGEDRDLLGNDFKFELIWAIHLAAKSPEIMAEIQLLINEMENNESN